MSVLFCNVVAFCCGYRKVFDKSSNPPPLGYSCDVGIVQFYRMFDDISSIRGGVLVVLDSSPHP